MNNGQRYLGDWRNWDGGACKECSKNHPSWAHKPMTPLSVAQIALEKQTKATIYVLSHRDKYDEDRRIYSEALLQLRIAEFDLAAADREVQRTEKAERTRIKRQVKNEIEKAVKRGDTEMATKLNRLLHEIRNAESELRSMEEIA